MIIDTWSFSNDFHIQCEEKGCSPVHLVSEKDRNYTLIEKCLDECSYFGVRTYDFDYKSLKEFDCIISLSEIFHEFENSIMPIAIDTPSMNGIVPFTNILEIPLLLISLKRFNQRYVNSMETNTFKVINNSVKGYKLLKQYINHIKPKKVLIIYAWSDVHYMEKHIHSYEKVLEILNESNSDIT